MNLPSDRPWVENARVLVLEDEFLIALELERIFEAAGAREVVITGRVEDAVAALARPEPFDLAVLDVQIGKHSSEEIALILVERRVPFVYGTGMDSSLAIPDRLRHIPVAAKPYNAQALLTALAQARAALGS